MPSLHHAVVPVVALVLCTLLVGAAAAQRSVMIFDFDSGGAHHPEGFGAWHVHVDGHRAEFAHTVRDEVTTYPEVTLTEEEHARFWRLVDAVASTEQANPRAQAMPGQPVMTVTVTRGARTTRVSAAGASTDRPAGLTNLLRYLADLIQRHTGQQPVMG